MTKVKMNKTELKYHVLNRGDTFFFDRKTMRFFGDTMSNYYTPAKPVLIDTLEGQVEAWPLYRRKPVRYGLKSTAYFRTDDYSQVFPIPTNNEGDL
jgi:hypothetical protein